MRCPFCSADDDKVVDSRAASGAAVIRRRRECQRCTRRFTTYERIEEQPLKVVKKDDRRQAYDREKLTRGLAVACEKRPVSPEAIEALVRAVEDDVLERYTTEVPVRALGELVMERLKALDPIAYVRFASVYREFKDVGEFVDEVQAIRPRD